MAFWFKEDSTQWLLSVQRKEIKKPEHNTWRGTGPSLRENRDISPKARQRPKSNPLGKSFQRD